MKTYLVVIDDSKLTASPEQIFMSINGVKSVTDTSNISSKTVPYTNQELDEIVFQMEEDKSAITLYQLKSNLEAKFEGKWTKNS